MTSRRAARALATPLFFLCSSNDSVRQRLLVHIEPGLPIGKNTLLNDSYFSLVLLTTACILSDDSTICKENVYAVQGLLEKTDLHETQQEYHEFLPEDR